MGVAGGDAVAYHPSPDARRAEAMDQPNREIKAIPARPGGAAMDLELVDASLARSTGAARDPGLAQGLHREGVEGPPDLEELWRPGEEDTIRHGNLGTTTSRREELSDRPARHARADGPRGSTFAGSAPLRQDLLKLPRELRCADRSVMKIGRKVADEVDLQARRSSRGGAGLPRMWVC